MTPRSIRKTAVLDFVKKELIRKTRKDRKSKKIMFTFTLFYFRSKNESPDDHRPECERQRNG